MGSGTSSTENTSLLTTVVPLLTASSSLRNFTGSSLPLRAASRSSTSHPRKSLRRSLLTLLNQMRCMLSQSVVRNSSAASPSPGPSPEPISSLDGATTSSVCTRSSQSEVVVLPNDQLNSHQTTFDQECLPKSGGNLRPSRGMPLASVKL